MGKTCFFFGHREADERLLPVLETTIERLIAEENVRYFYVGGYGGFDRIAACAVKNAKKQHPWDGYISHAAFRSRTPGGGFLHCLSDQQEHNRTVAAAVSPKRLGIRQYVGHFLPTL